MLFFLVFKASQSPHRKRKFCHPPYYIFFFDDNDDNDDNDFNATSIANDQFDTGNCFIVVQSYVCPETFLENDDDEEEEEE